MAVDRAHVVDDPTGRVVGHRAASERVHGGELAQRPAFQGVERRGVGGRGQLLGGALEVGEELRAARLAPADVEAAEQRGEAHLAVGGVAADHEEHERVGVPGLALGQAQLARAQRLVAPADLD